MVVMIGTLTQIRVVNASNEDLAYVIGMNRLRAAYLELDPDIEQYLVASAHDDDRGVWQTYNPLMGPNPTPPLATSAAFIVLVNSASAVCWPRWLPWPLAHLVRWSGRWRPRAAWPCSASRQPWWCGSTSAYNDATLRCFPPPQRRGWRQPTTSNVAARPTMRPHDAGGSGRPPGRPASSVRTSWRIAARRSSSPVLVRPPPKRSGAQA